MKRETTARRSLNLCHSRNNLAGAPGFEPGDGGIKIRCLTTWLRPNAQCAADHTGEAGPVNLRRRSRPDVARYIYLCSCGLARTRRYNDLLVALPCQHRARVLDLRRARKAMCDERAPGLPVVLAVEIDGVVLERLPFDHQPVALRLLDRAM
jgi:hypothetical protein